MTRSDRMKPIKSIADSRERDAGAVVTAAQENLQQCEQQLAQLLRYRDDYAKGNGESVGALDGMRLQNFRAFVQRLNDAIHQQEQAVQRAREDYERKRDAWRERRVEAKTLDRAIEKLRDHERKVDDRREQFKMDEQAAAQRRSRELADESGTWKVGSTGKWKLEK
jgi:flagellar protein FliJ